MLLQLYQIPNRMVVETDRNALWWYFASIRLCLALLFIISIIKKKKKKLNDVVQKVRDVWFGLWWGISNLVSKHLLFSLKFKLTFLHQKSSRCELSFKYSFLRSGLFKIKLKVLRRLKFSNVTTFLFNFNKFIAFCRMPSHRGLKLDGV